MLLEPSFYGFFTAVKTQTKIILFHAVSDVILLVGAQIAILQNNLTLSHPEYAAYILAAAALINYVIGVVWKTLRTINPDVLPKGDMVPVITGTELA